MRGAAYALAITLGSVDSVVNQPAQDKRAETLFVTAAIVRFTKTGQNQSTSSVKLAKRREASWTD